MILVLTLLLSLETAGLSSPNQEVVLLPNVENFSIVSSKELEFRVDDYKTVFVGRVVVYQNPNDTNEFVKVYYRQTAIVSERSKEKNSEGITGQDANLSNQNYHSKQEADTLDRVQQATDAFAYVQWRTVRDPRSGQDIRDGRFESWLLESNGSWALAHGHDLIISPFSEPSKIDSEKRIIVGIRFTLVATTHIVRVDQDDIITQTKEVVNDEK